VTTTVRAVGISRSFSGLRALDNVDLDVAAGQIVGLIGPNGSGKTTLLNVISGVIRPTAGRVVVGETDVTGWSASRVARQGLARTFQNIRLFGGMSVVENVEVGVVLAPHAPGGAARRRTARQILGSIGLDTVADRTAGTLPYGMQRRVEIARALASRPRFLLLDEPAAGMNEAESDGLLEFIARLRREHELGVLIVDHDLRLIMRLCDRITVLNEGHRISEGSRLDVRADPRVVEAYLGRRTETTGVVPGHGATALG